MTRGVFFVLPLLTVLIKLYKVGVPFNNQPKANSENAPFLWDLLISVALFSVYWQSLQCIDLRDSIIHSASWHLTVCSLAGESLYIKTVISVDRILGSASTCVSHWCHDTYFFYPYSGQFRGQTCPLYVKWNVKVVGRDYFHTLKQAPKMKIHLYFGLPPLRLSIDSGPSLLSQWQPEVSLYAFCPSYALLGGGTLPCTDS